MPRSSQTTRPRKRKQRSPRTPQQQPQPQPHPQSQPRQRPRLLPHLPLELVSEIASHLDRHTLAVLLRASKAFWDVAARHLYSDLHLDEDRLSRLLDGGIEPKYQGKTWTQVRVQGFRRRGQSRLSERTRRALALVRSLRLEPPVAADVYPKLWDLTVSNVALFPSVQRLTLAREVWGGGSWDRGSLPRYSPETDVFLFDSVDLCVHGHGCQTRLPYLPIRHCKTFSLHRVYSTDVLNVNREPGLPGDWDRGYIFQEVGIDFGRSNNWHWKYQWHVVCSGIQPPPHPIVVCVRNRTPEQPVLPNVHYYWDPAWAKTLSVAFNDECPNCVVCGKRWKTEPVSSDE